MAAGIVSLPIQRGIKVVWGVPEQLKRISGIPDANLPDTKIKLRLRNNAVGRVYVKTPKGIREFILKDCGDHWEAVFEQGLNFRP